MEKTVSQELSENGFFTIYDVLDFIDNRIKSADENASQHYMFVKCEIESKIVDILKHRSFGE